MKAKRLISLISAVILTAGLMLPTLQYNIHAKEAEETEEKELFVSGDFEYYLNEDGTVTISDYSGEAGELQLPDEIDGYMVSAIDSGAFFLCGDLRSIEIPDSVTNIGDSAFYGCSSLKTIEIPDNVTSIGDLAFYWCEDLTAIVSSGSYAEQYCMENRIEYTYPED